MQPLECWCQESAAKYPVPSQEERESDLHSDSVIHSVPGTKNIFIRLYVVAAQNSAPS